MPIQVAHVVPFADRIGGYERQALLLATSQIQRGQNVAVITHSTHARALRDRTTGLAVHGVNWRFGRAAVRAIDRAIATADVLHVHAIDPFSAAVVWRARRRGAPAVVKIATQGDAQRYADPHRHPPEVAAARLFEPWRLRRQQRLMAQAWRVMRDCEHFIALSGAIESELLEVGIPAGRMARLPNAVTIPPNPVEIRPVARRAVYLGRLEERKRIGDLLDAFALVRAAQPEAHLEIIGEGAGRGALEAKASGAAFRGRVADASALLAAADLFIFPSEREGCPNALLEAAAAGVPCIATHIPGIIDWFDASMMVLVPPRRPDLIASAWLDLWGDRVRRAAMADAARHHVRAIASLEVLGETYARLYETVAAR